MNEFIYSIKSIFEGIDSVLTTNHTTCFYIGPYQRGYKWESNCRYDQVPQLLIDIYNAFTSGVEDYYLQYLTVKKNGSRLEVIDGQQRLTTLSLLYYCLEDISSDIHNITKKKLEYERHSGKLVFEDVLCLANNIIKLDNSKRLSVLQNLETQDLYYMVSAAVCIKNFLNLLDAQQLSDFVCYLANNVKLIVNLENQFVKSEEVFANLNDNKVSLTDVYLVKGLLLTKSISHSTNSGTKRNYKEILDQRVVMGRTWDEIYSWISLPYIAQFFFGKANQYRGMDELLKLIDLPHKEFVLSEDLILSKFVLQLNEAAKAMQFNETSFPIFNRMNEAIIDSKDAQNILSQLKHIYRKFQSLWNDNQGLYPLVGYVLFADPSSRIDTLKNYLNKDNDDFAYYIKDKALKILPDMDSMKRKDIPLHVLNSYPQLNYYSGNQLLGRLLLSFSVFPESMANSYRFDFYSYDTEKWTFEHIFPQNPSKTVKIAPIAKQIVIRAIQNQKDLSEDEKKELIEKVENEKDIEASHILFLYNADFEVDSLGNMALLTGSVNSALSNNPYIAKRPILTQKCLAGDFIPRHTLDVFNKTISPDSNDYAFNPELSFWNESDVLAHIVWMEQRNKSIREELSKIISE